MSNRGRKGTRGNAQRGAGPRLSNAPALAAYARAANSETPPPVASIAPAEARSTDAASESAESLSPLSGDSAPLERDSVLPKAAVLEALGDAAIGANDDDEPPPSSTRSRQAAGPAQDRLKPEAKPVGAERAERAAIPRADKPKRAERRSKDRGKGARNSSAPPGPARGAHRQAATPSTVDALVSSGASGPSSADLADKFFEEGVKSEHEMLSTHDKPRLEAAAVHDDEEPTDLKILHKMLPEVRARRAKYARYVTVVSAGCILLALAGLVRHKIARGDQEVAARDMAAYAAAHAPENAPVENIPPAAVGQPPALAEPSAPASAAPSASAAALPTPPPIAEAPAASAGDKSEAKPEAPATSPPADTETPHAKTAAQEKRDCQVLLDRGAFGKAIDAGERSVGLDPTDGEAWLLLGAAYQSMGRVADARRSFSACLKQGKKGPLGECKAMLQ